DCWRSLTASRTAIAPNRFCSTSSSTRVQRIVTSENSAATKKPFMSTSRGTARKPATSRMVWIMGARGGSESIHLAAAFESPRERHLIRVLEIGAHRHAARDARHLDADRGEQAREVECRRLAGDVGIGREDHFLDRVLARRPQQMERETLRALLSDGRKLHQLLHQEFQVLRAVHAGGAIV